MIAMQRWTLHATRAALTTAAALTALTLALTGCRPFGSTQPPGGTGGPDGGVPAGTSEHTLSMDVIKKTDEIEKLTKRIRSKMRGD